MANPREKTFDIPLSFKFYDLNDTPPSSRSPGILILFINGLMLPQTHWTPTIDILKTSFTDITISVSCITYDRYGQGQSRPASQPEWKPERHDLLYAAEELAGVSCRFISEHRPSNARPKILFVSHSIGVPLARLYTERHPDVSAHLFLDSNPANTDFVSIYPDPDAEDFDSAQLPNDSTVEDSRTLRKKTAQMFRPDVPNPEGLDRSNVGRLLPYADKPKLVGPGGKFPYLTVVGHDREAFAEEGFRLNGTPKGLNFKYMQPFWENYNQGLLQLSDQSKTKGVVIAKEAGHFIQRDNPHCVAHEITKLVARLIMED